MKIPSFTSSLTPYLAMSLLVISTQALPRTIEIAASADATINRGTPNSNNGLGTILDVKPEPDVARTVVKFNLEELAASGITGADIESAFLEFDITLNYDWEEKGSTAQYMVTAHRQMSDWKESEVSWDCSDLNCSAAGWFGGEFNPTGTHSAKAATRSQNEIIPLDSRVQFDLTLDVKEMIDKVVPNFGWLIKKDMESETGIIQFSSREGTSAPRLILTLNREIDLQPPVITIIEPSEEVYIDEAPPLIQVSYHDDMEGVDITTLKLLLNGEDLLAQCSTPTESAVTCQLPADKLTNGEHVITASIADKSGKISTLHSTFSYFLNQDTTAPKWVEEPDSVHTDVNVGIGKSNPEEALDVEGNAAVSGNITANSVLANLMETDSLTVSGKLKSTNEIEAQQITVINSLSADSLSAASVSATSVSTSSVSATSGTISNDVDRTNPEQITNVKYVEQEINSVLPEAFDENYVLKWDEGNNKLVQSRIKETPDGIGVNLPQLMLPQAALDVLGDTRLAGNVSVLGSLSLTQNAVLDGQLTVKNQANFDNDVTVNGTSTFTQDLIAQNNATITNDLSVGGNATTQGNATVKGELVAEKSVSVTVVNPEKATHATNVEFVNGAINGVDNRLDDSVTAINSDISRIDDTLSSLQSTINTIPEENTTNELQTISKSGNTVTLSHNGGSFIVDDADASTSNEIQNLAEVLSVGNNAGSINITNLASPEAELDAVNKRYVDEQIAAVLEKISSTSPVGPFFLGDNVHYSSSDTIINTTPSWKTGHKVKIPKGGDLKLEYLTTKIGNPVGRHIRSEVFVNDVLIKSYDTGNRARSLRIQLDLTNLQAGDIILVRFRIGNSAQARYIDAQFSDFKLMAGNQITDFQRLN